MNEQTETRLIKVALLTIAVFVHLTILTAVAFVWGLL